LVSKLKTIKLTTCLYLYFNILNVFLKLKNELLHIVNTNVFGKDIKGVIIMFKFNYFGKNRERRSSSEGL